MESRGSHVEKDTAESVDADVVESMEGERCEWKDAEVARWFKLTRPLLKREIVRNSGWQRIV
jgi:hypothetical protein